MERGNVPNCIGLRSRGFTYLSKRFRNVSGSLAFEAEIQSDNVIPGGAFYECGKFQAVVVVNGKE